MRYVITATILCLLVLVGTSASANSDTIRQRLSLLLSKITEVEKEKHMFEPAIAAFEQQVKNDVPLLLASRDSAAAKAQQIFDQYHRKLTDPQQLEIRQREYDQAYDHANAKDDEIKWIMRNNTLLQEKKSELENQFKKLTDEYLSMLVPYIKSRPCQDELLIAMDADAVLMTSTKLEQLYYCAQLPFDGKPLGLPELKIFGFGPETGFNNVVNVTDVTQQDIDRKRIMIQKQFEQSPPPAAKKPIVIDVPKPHIPEPTLSDRIKAYIKQKSRTKTISTPAAHRG